MGATTGGTALSDCSAQHHHDLYCRIIGSGNSDYGSYCNSPTDPALPGVSDIQNAPLIQTSDEEEDGLTGGKGSNPLDYVKIAIPEEERKKSEKIPQEPLKTLLAALFLGTGFLVTSLSLAFTHDRHPGIDPLPDVVLDNIKYQSWGLDVSEYLLMISTLSAILVVALHKHRLIILRRIWLLLGVLYYYRALTFFVTVLPKADEEYECAPISNNTSAMGMYAVGHQTMKLTLTLSPFRLHQESYHDIIWWGTLDQREPHLLWRLHLQWTHHDPDYGLPGYQAM